MFVQPGKPYLADEHVRARQLRYLGASIREIARHVGVSQSTVSVWVRDIELLPRHRERNLRRASEARATQWIERNRAERLKHQQAGRERARRGEPLHAMGCMLYWAEGAKERNTASFANSDPAMVAFFIRFLRECFGIEKHDLRFRLNVYLSGELTLDDVEAYWCDKLGLDSGCARKHVVNHFPTSSSGKKVNKLPYGVCTVSVNRSTWLVQHIFGAIQEYSGVDQPQWLDGPPRKKNAPTSSSASSPS